MKVKNQPLIIFLIAFVVRLFGAVVTTITNLNPDSTADAVRFGETANMIAKGILVGKPYEFTTFNTTLIQLLLPLGDGSIYQLWGTFLAPLWLLPGPSGFYARICSAFFGAVSVYNIYLLAKYYYSGWAGTVASLPLIFYPSVIAVQSTLLREAFILFGITTIARYSTRVVNQRFKLRQYLLIGSLFYAIIILRTDNIVIYASAFGAALLAWLILSGKISKPAIGLGILLSPSVLIFLAPILQRGVDFLARTRELRAKGRAVYLTDVIPRTLLQLIAFSWVGSAYFLYAPFPWMVETMPDLIISIEGMLSIACTVAAIWGVRYAGQRNVPLTTGLIVGFVTAIVLYGVGTANYGTGMRHRQMFLWILFLFGGIGIAEHVQIVGTSRTSRESAA